MILPDLEEVRYLRNFFNQNGCLSKKCLHSFWPAINSINLFSSSRICKMGQFRMAQQICNFQTSLPKSLKIIVIKIRYKGIHKSGDGLIRKKCFAELVPQEAGGGRKQKSDETASIETQRKEERKSDKKCVRWREGDDYLVRF